MPAIEQIQHGSLTFTGTTLSQTAELSPPVADVNNAIVFYSAWGGGGADRPNRTFCRAKFNSTSQIQFDRDDDGYDAQIEWTVIEFANGEITNKQTGQVNATSSTTDVALSPAVDLDRTLAMWFHTTAQASSPNASTTFKGEFTSTTNYRFSSQSTPSLDDFVAEWATIEFKAGAVNAVHAGDFPDLGAGPTNQVEVTLPTVDRGKTLITHSWNTTSGGTFWSRSKVRCFFFSDTVLRARRNQTGGATITVRAAYLVMEFVDLFVQTQSPTMGDTATTATATFGTPVDNARASVWIPNTWQNAEQDEDSSMNHRYSLATQLETSTTQTQLERESAGPSGTVITYEAFLVEWSLGGGAVVEREVTDTATPTDEALKEEPRSLSDAVGATDSAEAEQQVTVELADTVAATDEAQAQSATGRTLSDTATPTDSVDADIQRGRIVSDDVAASDQATIEQNLQRELADTVAASDQAQKTVSINLELSDTVTASDDAQPGLANFEQVEDTATPSDSVEEETAFGETVSDAVTVADSVELEIVSDRVVSDLVDPQDLAAASGASSDTVADTAIVLDQAFFQIEGLTFQIHLAPAAIFEPLAPEAQFQPLTGSAVFGHLAPSLEE